MPRTKEEHKNWITSHTDDIVDVLRKGPHFAASFKGRDNIVVVIPATEDGSLIMGEVYRAALDEISLEFLSGYTQEDESLLEAATRVATTQVGKISEYPTFIGEVFPAPGILDLRVHLFTVRVPLSASQALKPSGDLVTLRPVSIQELTETIAKGGASDATTIASLMKYLTRAKEGIGSLPTRMHSIEILDAREQVLTTVLTNKPEWSFMEYAQANSRAKDWRFKSAVEEVSSHTPSEETSPSQDRDPTSAATDGSQEAIDADPGPAVTFRSANRPKSATAAPLDTPAPKPDAPRRLNLSVPEPAPAPEPEHFVPAPVVQEPEPQAPEFQGVRIIEEPAPQPIEEETDEAGMPRPAFNVEKTPLPPQKKDTKPKADGGGVSGFFKRTLARIHHSVDSEAAPTAREEAKPAPQQTIYAPHADIFDAPPKEHSEDNGFHWPVRSQR